MPVYDGRLPSDKCGKCRKRKEKIRQLEEVILRSTRTNQALWAKVRLLRGAGASTVAGAGGAAELGVGVTERETKVLGRSALVGRPAAAAGGASSSSSSSGSATSAAVSVSTSVPSDAMGIQEAQSASETASCSSEDKENTVPRTVARRLASATKSPPPVARRGGVGASPRVLRSATRPPARFLDGL